MAHMHVDPDNQPDLNAQMTIEKECWKRLESTSLSIDTYRIGGICPACKHPTFQDQPVGMVFGFRSIEKKRLPKIIGPIEVWCACNIETVPVPDSDTNRKGCGWHHAIAFKICEQ
jgi:hypothetical protein